MGKKICVVIPVYNEAPVVAETIKSVPKKIDGIPVDIVVVNDGSTDTTKKVVEKSGKAILINHILNFGAGAATRTGLYYAKENKYDYVATMDADGQHSSKDLIKVVTAVEQGNSDIVIGSRLINSSGMPWYRRLGNVGLSFITLLLFGVNVKDSQSGLKAMNRKAIQVIDFNSNRFAFCSEMIWRAKREGLKISETPIQAIYTSYSLSKGQSNWGSIAILKQLIKQRVLSILNG